MTKKERAKVNKQNAQKSTGPKTAEGKEASRGNSMKHGFAAKVLSLPTENPLAIQAICDDWVKSLDPVTPDERALVEQAALSTIRLKRLAVAESGIIGDQVREAETGWDMRQKEKLLDLLEIFPTDAPRAVIGLESFALGLKWMLQRWQEMKKAFKAANYWCNMELIKDSARLLGANPDKLTQANYDTFDIVYRALYRIPDYLSLDCVREFLCNNESAVWDGRHSRNPTLDHDEGEAIILARVDSEIERITQLLAVREEIEHESRTLAQYRAMAPANTDENRLWLRYVTRAESSLDRSLKTLLKLRKERRESGDFEKARNEADRPWSPTETADKADLYDDFPSFEEDPEEAEIASKTSYEPVNADSNVEMKTVLGVTATEWVENRSL